MSGPAPKSLRAERELRQHDLVVVANRLPIMQSPDAPGGWERSPGGLVASLDSVVTAMGTTWVGWSGAADGSSVPTSYGGVRLHEVSLSSDEIDQFYGGFSNGSLWPLYHDAIFVPQFDKRWWNAYVAVNQRFAEAAAKVAPNGATVWVHDYQLQLVPQMLRRLRHDVRIGFFLHIPFPAQELFLRLPWRSEITEGLLGADVVGFQTKVGAQNFRQVARRLLHSRSEGKMLDVGGRPVLVDTFPVGIDAKRVQRVASDPATIARAAAIREELGNPRTVLLGVDRLDYTKGIEVRLMAFRELLEEGRIDAADTVFVQIAQPSRDDVPGYSEIRTQVEQMAGSINGDFGRMNGAVVRYLHQGQAFEELVALYRAADVMLVTPFRDGMNLVAKEYVASRLDHTGVLILSEFTGAAHQLTEAVQVNPYDVDGLKQAIDDAVNGEDGARTKAMALLIRKVHRYDSAHWVTEFLEAMEHSR